jgi:hypothetical protein
MRLNGGFQFDMMPDIYHCTLPGSGGWYRPDTLTHDPSRCTDQSFATIILTEDAGSTGNRLG